MALTEIKLAYFKAALNREKEKLIDSEIDNLRSDDDRIDIKTRKAHNSDETVQADAAENAVALEGHILESIARIELALARIELKVYGTCIDCHQDIPYDRLQAFPAAARCVKCKSIFENIDA